MDMNLRLKKALMEHSERQYIVAKKIGVHYSTMSKFIAEIQEPTNDQKRRISEILNIKESEIFQVSEE
jgi:DNA-binding XRE family transcriptional regulator